MKVKELIDYLKKVDNQQAEVYYSISNEQKRNPVQIVTVHKIRRITGKLGDQTHVVLSDF
jgi:hypothetical protein